MNSNLTQQETLDAAVAKLRKAADEVVRIAADHGILNLESPFVQDRLNAVESELRRCLKIKEVCTP